MIRRRLAVLAVASALVAPLAGAAFAQQPFGRPGPGSGKGPGPQPVPAGQDARERGAPAAPGRAPERMSPEERHQLRRDIEQHGREIYRDPRGGPGRR